MMVDENGEVVTVRGLSVKRLRDQYNDWDGAKSEEMREQKDARRYYHGDQLSAYELAVLKERRQPAIINNIIARKINGIVGLVERGRKDPKAYARTPKEAQKADVATEGLRYAFDRVDWTTVSNEVSRNAAINGIGVVELFLEPSPLGDQDVGIISVEADSFFYDPRSTRHDFSDARFMGVVKWLDIEAAVEMFPDKESELRALLSSGGWPEGNQQEDREKSWASLTAKRVRVVEHWYIAAGEWQWCFYSGDVELARGVSEFSDEQGKTICKYLAFSANVDHGGDRYGFVRNWKPLQQEENARRSKGLHLLNTRRVIAQQGAVDDVEKARKEIARPDGWIEVNPGFDFEFDDAARQADLAGQLEFMRDARMQIEGSSFNPALVGTGVQGMSGKAQEIQQDAGAAELGPYLLTHRGWKLRVYRAVWSTIKRVWTAERWVMITDEDGQEQRVPINPEMADEYGFPILDQMGQIQREQTFGMLDVDIILDEGPDTITIQESTERLLSAFAQNGVPVPPAMLIEASDLPDKVKRRLLATFQQKEGDPLAGEKAALEMENAKAEVGKTKAEALDKFASASQKFAQAFAPQPLPGEYGGDGSLPMPGAGQQPGGLPPMTMPPEPAPQAAPLPF